MNIQNYKKITNYKKQDISITVDIINIVNIYYLEFSFPSV